MSAFSSPLLVLSGGGALVVVVARAVPLAAGRLGSALSTGNKLFLRRSLEAQTRPVVEAVTAAGVVVLTTAGVGVSVTSIIVASVATSLRRVCEQEIGLGRQTIHAGAKLTLLLVPVLVTCFPPPGIFLRVDFFRSQKRTFPD